MFKLNSVQKSKIFGGTITMGTAISRTVIGVSSFFWALLDISNIVIDHIHNKSKLNKQVKNVNLYDYTSIESKNLILS